MFTVTYSQVENNSIPIDEVYDYVFSLIRVQLEDKDKKPQINRNYQFKDTNAHPEQVGRTVARA